jgi:hypothetical protein
MERVYRVMDIERGCTAAAYYVNLILMLGKNKE